MADVAAFFSGEYGRGLEGTDELYVVDAIKSIQKEEQQRAIQPQVQIAHAQQTARGPYESMGEADMAGRLARISAGCDSMGVPAPPPKPIEASLGDLRRAADGHKALLEKLDKRAFINKYGKTIGKMLKPRQCTRCQTAFTLADSIGAWQCRMHPGQLVEGRWNCCGQFAGPLDRLHVALKFHIDPGSASGCTPVDHTYMYLSNDGVGDGRGVWRVPPELRRLLLYKPFRAIEPPHSDAWRFSAIWNARSSKEAGSSSLSVTEHVPDATEMEAAIRSGSCIARSSARYDELGAKSIYAGYKSSDAEERRRSREQASRDILVTTSPLALWDSKWIGKHAFVELERARFKAR